MSLAIFIADRDCLQRAAREDGTIHRALRLEVVLGLAHLDAEAGAQTLGHPLGELGVGIDAGADSRAAESYLGELVHCFVDARDAALYLARIALELLAETDRGGVLEMRPACLYDVVELSSLLFECSVASRGPGGGPAAWRSGLPGVSPWG